MKQSFFTKKRIIAGVVVFAVVLLAAGGVYAAQTYNQIVNDPTSLFAQTFAPVPADEETPEASPTVSPLGTTPGQTDASEQPTPTSTIDPLKNLQDQADMSILKDTFHILLIGVDYAGERTKWVKNFNSDVMLLLAINFKQNKVDMISFPRDTYAKIANIDGFYKLNFALTAGGGTNDMGFMNVCNSIKGILGDKRIPPVDKYIAVTMESIKKLTDAIGGVDYNVDINFRINGREYKKGKQHMNGQAVLDYCRVRKTAGTGYISEDGGDLNRVDRQKRMLVAVFKKLQTTSTIFDVPNILTSLKGEVFTNLDFKQLAALAVWGKDLQTEKITLNKLEGYEYNLFNWKFVLTYQERRVALFKKVYGITVAQQYKYDESYARVLWAYMEGEAWLKEINKFLTYDTALAVEKKKFTNVDDMAKLTASIDTTQRMMNKFRSRLFRDSKPVFSNADRTEAEKDVLYMKKIADAMFIKAGYKADWDVAANKPGSLKMIE